MSKVALVMAGDAPVFADHRAVLEQPVGLDHGATEEQSAHTGEAVPLRFAPTRRLHAFAQSGHS
jgi:hypothetical protein